VKIGDRRALPAMVGVIVADDTHESVYWVGYYGLSKLLDVPYQATHDGPWWERWWAENQERLPAEARGPLPRPSLRARR
jgi:hypothetical protein